LNGAGSIYAKAVVAKNEPGYISGFVVAERPKGLRASKSGQQKKKEAS
jgi:hypothetical protein